MQYLHMVVYKNSFLIVKIIVKMTSLCEIKSVSFFRNADNFAIYFTAKKVGCSELISAKILLSELPCCILDQYLYLELGGIIGKQKQTHKVGKKVESTEIDRYQLQEIQNYQRNKTFGDLKCGSSTDE